MIIAGGRRLPNLLVITNKTKLGTNIGSEQAAEVVDALRTAGLTVITDAPTGPDPEKAIRKARKILQDGKFEGVLIVGGYDVVPAVRLSVIDDELRSRIKPDEDDYVVWSDDAYAALDDDGVPDLPVSRIPDASDAGLVFACLSCATKASSVKTAFGLRNKLRPFADRVFLGISKSPCLESWPTDPLQVDPTHLQAGHLYFMLHGHYIDGDQFTGERSFQNYCLAIDRSRIPQYLDGVVLAGCCYGALLTRFPAVDTRPEKSPAARSVDDSMALSLLKAGAIAFVGCTGVHYSPPEDLPDTNGEPMHKAFWKHLLAGNPPAKALFLAKREYLAGIPHSGIEDDYAESVELKIYSEFTCLGLGW